LKAIKKSGAPQTKVSEPLADRHVANPTEKSPTNRDATYTPADGRDLASMYSIKDRLTQERYVRDSLATGNPHEVIPGATSAESSPPGATSGSYSPRLSVMKSETESAHKQGLGNRASNIFASLHKKIITNNKM